MRPGISHSRACILHSSLSVQDLRCGLKLPFWSPEGTVKWIMLVHQPAQVKAQSQSLWCPVGSKDRKQVNWQFLGQQRE